MIRSLSVVRHQHSQRGQSHHLYFQYQLGNPDTVLHRGQKLPPTVLTLFRKKKKVCFSKQTWRVKSCNRLRENERKRTRYGRLKACRERVKRKKKSHCKEEKSFLYLERETLRYPCDISFRSSYTAEASKTSLPFHFLANYICVLDWM